LFAVLRNQHGERVVTQSSAGDSMERVEKDFTSETVQNTNLQAITDVDKVKH
jgi:hypothetical protein